MATPLRVKLCGIRSRTDLTIALHTGAQAIADRIGGTGLPHDWSISRRIAEQSRRPVILAGGLRPENLEQALRAVGPAADPCGRWGKLPRTP